MDIESPLQIPSKLRQACSDYKLISQTTTYAVYEAKLLQNQQIVTIRALDTSAEAVKTNYAFAATLFVQELLRICSLHPDLLFLNTFEIDLSGKMGFATLPYTSLRDELDNLQSAKANGAIITTFSGTKSVKDLISDVLSDIEFLTTKLNARNCHRIINIQNIYHFKEKDTYFLGDWANILNPKNYSIEHGNGELEKQPDEPNLNVADEIFELGLAVLELNGLSQEKLESISASNSTFEGKLNYAVQEVLEDDNCTLPAKTKSLVERMLKKDENLRPKLEEFSSIRAKREAQFKGFETANLRQHGITDFALATLLSSTYGAWKSLKHLNLAENAIHDKGIIELADYTGWKKLESLDLSQNKIGDRGAVELGKNIAWTKLHTLNLQHNSITSSGAAELFKNTAWVHLKSLSLGYNAITDVSFMNDNTSWTELESLNLAGNKLGDQGASDLSKNTSWTQLKYLNLRKNGITDRGAEDLQSNVSWKELRVLDLVENRIGEKGISTLATNTTWLQLEELLLDRNPVYERGAAFLARNKTWKNLKTLSIADCTLGIIGAQTMVKNNIEWTNLQALNLTLNNIDDEGVGYLSQSTVWQNLESLDLCWNSIGWKGAEHLAKNETWKRLKVLILKINFIGDKGAAALSGNTSWTELQTLNLWGNSIGPEGSAALSRNTSWEKLKKLDLSKNLIGDAGAAALGENSSWKELETLDIRFNLITQKGAACLKNNVNWTRLKKFSY